MKIEKETAKFSDDSTLECQALVRIDSTIQIEYYRHGGILQMVLRRLMKA